jgi:hypothetical protein
MNIATSIVGGALIFGLVGCTPSRHSAASGGRQAQSTQAAVVQGWVAGAACRLDNRRVPLEDCVNRLIDSGDHLSNLPFQAGLRLRAYENIAKQANVVDKNGVPSDPVDCLSTRIEATNYYVLLSKSGLKHDDMKTYLAGVDKPLLPPWNFPSC